MKKKGAILSLLLAGVMSVGVVATAGCKQHEGHVHTWTSWETDKEDETKHTRKSTCLDHATVTETKPHSYDNDGDATCNDCSYVRTIGGGGGGEIENPDPVVLSEDTAISLTVGESQEISAADGAVFASQHTNVATVDNKGKITAKAAGVAKITATAGTSVVTCTVIVLAPLSNGSQTTNKDPFTFAGGTVDIGSVSESDLPPVAADSDAEEHSVTFTEADGASVQYVEHGAYAVEPLVEKDGSYLTGWKLNGSDYDFNAPVNQSITLEAQWEALPSGISKVEGNQESVAVEFTGGANTVVQYKKNGGADWTTVDAQLVRGLGGNSARVDILGLSAGVYSVKIGATEITDVRVKAYDRSGYAHFNYTDGIGAYNDDGTLKDNALVIYVTEENKDTVMKDLAETNTLVRQQMFDIPYYAGIKGADKNWNKQAEGIGWWLNNVQYTKKDKNGNVASNTYSESGSSLGFGNTAFDNIPIVVRFIGTVTTPEGCTAYNCLGEGGSVGDNGHMARMKNLKNVTIEGVGDDATIYGWGFHFMAGSDAKNGRGKGFEVRNLTFDKVPEDCVGMEGVQQDNKAKGITGSVERCWVHNNVFLEGYCASPAESDKGEGDGSCDFKRGQYFTLSYNYFINCHKTNLIGSADSSYQYNITMHHNMWYNCKARIPLIRQANCHYYNNYVYGESGGTMDQVHSLRANSYVFSEANFYEGRKKVAEDKNSGGVAKGWKNVYSSCFDEHSITDVSARDEYVANNCEHCGGISSSTGSVYSLAHFDTDPTLFYYDATNKKTDALVDDPVSARTRVLQYVGTVGFAAGNTKKMLEANTYTPAAAVTNGTVDLSKAATGATVNGVYVNDFKGGKGKGQLMTFTLSAPTLVNIEGSGKEADHYPQVIRSDGKVVIAKFNGSVSVELAAGTYVITSGQKDKESYVTALSFEAAEGASEARVNAAKTALAAIGNTVTRNSKTVIEAARKAYGALSADEKQQISSDLYSRYVKAENAYTEISVNYVIARINYIGTVTKYSDSDISLAQAAYNELDNSAKSKVTNYSALVAAISAFSAFKGDAMQGAIDRLPATSVFPLIIDSKPAIEVALVIFNDVLDDYNSLDKENDDESAIIDRININPVTDAIATLTAALKPFEVKDMIAALDETASNYMSQAGALKAAYTALTTAQQAMLTADEKQAYDKAVAAYDEYASKAKLVLFTAENDSKLAGLGFTISGSKSYRGKTDTFEYNNETYISPLKVQSDTVITFSTATNMTAKLMLHSSKKQTVNVDGTQYTATGGIVTVNLEAGSHKIERSKDGECWLCYVELAPAA